MKKLTLTLVFMIIFILSYSQTFNINIGYNTSIFNSNIEKFNSKKESLSIGITTDILINERNKVEFGFDYLKKGSEFFIKYDNYHYNKKIELKTINFPIFYKKYFNKKTYVLIGLYYSYFIDGKISTFTNYDYNINDNVLSTIINPYDFGLKFGIGKEFKHFSIKYNNEYGIINLNIGDNYTNYYNRNHIITLSYIISKNN